MSHQCYDVVLGDVPQRKQEQLFYCVCLFFSRLGVIFWQIFRRFGAIFWLIFRWFGVIFWLIFRQLGVGIVCKPSNLIRFPITCLLQN